MKYAIVLGTRPEIIKMSPIIRFLEKEDKDFFILHSNQHYSKELDQVFFEELNIPLPKYNLGVGSASHAVMTAKILEGVEGVLSEEKTNVVLVQGDTNTVMAAALAASKMGVKVGHVEAGLRSYDRNMPEEINRVIADHISDYLFAPTEKSAEILKKEAIPENKIFTVGNTIVDAVLQNRKLAKNKSHILEKMKLKSDKYILLTLHRPSNVDNKDVFEKIVAGLEKVVSKLEIPIIFPVHPRTKSRMQDLGISLPPGVKATSPVGFLDFLQLENNAKLILTDSGGIQEEACILGVPAVTIRENTERPETVEAGANVLAGTDPDKILQSALTMSEKKCDWDNPLGDGKAAERIIKIIG